MNWSSEMKYHLAFVLICLISFLYAQEKILIAITPEIGIEVDREERDRYEWFPEVPNFISARFFLLQDETYEIQIRFFQNGQINEQNRVITAEAFYDAYQSIFEHKEVEEKEERRLHRKKRITERITRKQIVNLRLTDSEVKNVEIVNIEGDSIGVVKSSSNKNIVSMSQQMYAIADIEHISTIRNTNPALNLGIGIAPGAITGLITYTRFEDDHYDRNADEKALKVFYFGEIIGLSVSGTITAMKSIDYDYIFSNLTEEQKKEKIHLFVNRGIRKKATVRLSPWLGIYHFPNYLENQLIFPGLRYSICFSPRSRMEFMYGYSEWSLNEDMVVKTRYSRIKEYINFQVFRIGLRTDMSYHQNFNPFIAWGWGFFGKQFKRRYLRDDHYYSNHEEKDRNLDVLLNLDLGLEHHFNRWVSLEARISFIENIDYGLQYMGQLGLHLGRIY
jgi:hypothetical protein